MKIRTARTKLLVNSAQANSGSIARGIDANAVSRKRSARLTSVGRAVSLPSIVSCVMTNIASVMIPIISARDLVAAEG